jgi:hypothetical protein
LIKPERKEVHCSVEIPTLEDDWQEASVGRENLGRNYLEVTEFLGLVKN